MPEYDYAYGKHDHHKGIFFVATILTVGLCSVFPAMCFKSFSAKERRGRKQRPRRRTHSGSRKLQRAMQTIWRI